MITIITRKDEFVGKKNNVPYVKLSYIAKDGNAGTILTTQERFSLAKYNQNKILSKEQVEELFSNPEKVTVIDFDQNGFLTDID